MTANFLVGIIAAEHFVIAFFEMFLWTRLGIHERLKRLNMTSDDAKKAAPIVANAGLYNAFLAAGLACSLFSTVDSLPAKFFFLSCIAVAGIYGAFTLQWTIILIQTLPALGAMLWLWAAYKPA